MELALGKNVSSLVLSANRVVMPRLLRAWFTVRTERKPGFALQLQLSNPISGSWTSVKSHFKPYQNRLPPMETRIPKNPDNRPSLLLRPFKHIRMAFGLL